MQVKCIFIINACVLVLTRPVNNHYLLGACIKSYKVGTWKTVEIKPYYRKTKILMNRLARDILYFNHFGKIFLNELDWS